MTSRGSHAAARVQRPRSAPWFTRVRAVLAGALVLGVGGSLTLAAWTDTENASADFKASTFSIEGSLTGATDSFSKHPDTGPAKLSFSLTPTAMSPGSTVYAKYVVRTTAATSVDGKVRLDGAKFGTTDTGLGTYLTYRVRLIPPTNPCDVANFTGSTTPVVQGAGAVPVPLTTGAAETNFQDLQQQSRTTVAYCFEVLLPVTTPNTAQGKSVTATWTFAAQSNS